MKTAALRSRRQASLAAANKISAQALDGSDNYVEGGPNHASRSAVTRRAKDASQDKAFEPETSEPPAKKRRVGGSKKNGDSGLHRTLFGPVAFAPAAVSCDSPLRRHAVAYHRPLLLDGKSGKDARESLLKWFDSVSSDRRMPWRKDWIDVTAWQDHSEVRVALEKRAYEVWISEIMLQQTRVAVVIDYWNRWMAQWPTIQDLAVAHADDVLLAWRGLGYYSRATRIHEAAKIVVGAPEMKGLLPSDPAVLEAKIPGVGRYTAGAICSIVFGKPVAMVDGNVLRVLSRQLGIFGDVKTDKAVIDVLWGAADALVKAVAQTTSGDGGDLPTSDRPGRWGQALMELGSTVCAPKPNCAACPISSTCRAYGEGVAITTKNKSSSPATRPKRKVDEVVPIEDICGLCQPFEEAGDEADPEFTNVDENPDEKTKSKKVAKVGLTSAFFDDRNLAIATNHARKFPLKTIKKAIREQDTLVCAIRRSDGKHLIHRRPEKGLLAGLWELPSHELPASSASKTQSRKKAAMLHVSGLLSRGGKGKKTPGLSHMGEVGVVPWVFSHLKLTMHVHLFTVDDLDCAGTGGCDESSDKLWRWAETDAIDGESMGTGMRKCWAMAKAAHQED